MTSGAGKSVCNKARHNIFIEVKYSLEKLQKCLNDSSDKGQQSMLVKRAETLLKITCIHLSIEIFDYGEHKAAHKYGKYGWHKYFRP